MDSEKLKALQIKPEARKRPQRSFWIIFLGVALLTAGGAFYALPRKGEERRFLPEAKNQPASHPASNASAAPRSSTAAVAPPANGVVLTVSGYIVNRERIELSPRFIGVVKWIGVRKGDTVTNGQVVVLLDDAEQKARLKEVEGRLAGAKASVEKAELDYGRAMKLSQDRVESKEAEDAARIRLDSARATMKEIEGQYDLARTYLDWTVI